MRPLAVVTGAAGFIGSHMVDLLVERGFNVRAIDNLKTGRAANLRDHLGGSSVELLEVDLAALEPSQALFQGARYVFHFAGLGDIVPSIERPLDYMHANVPA